MTRLLVLVILSLVACGGPVQTPAVQETPSLTALPSPAASFAAATPSPAASTSTETPAPTSDSPAGTTGVGYRIQIPRLGINLPINEGSPARDVVFPPEGSAFHWPGTPWPGGGGNSFIYAHARVGMFLNLWQARVGDEVIVTNGTGGKLVYVVTEIHPRVDTFDTSWLAQGGPERLTLQTSTGPTAADPKFIVVAQER